MSKPQGAESLEQLPLEADASIDTGRHLLALHQWAEFLAKDPPWKEQKVTGASEPHYFQAPTGTVPSGWQVSLPPIKVFCPSEECGTETWFDCLGGNKRRIEEMPLMTLILTYRCRHCQRMTKQYAVNLLIEQLQSTVAPIIKATKFGEWPPYGQNPPKRLRKLLGEEDFDFLSKGLRTESQGLGIGVPSARYDWREPRSS